MRNVQGKDFMKNLLTMSKKKLVIELNEYSYNCADGCCTNYGTIVKVDGVEMPYHNQDTPTILEEVLRHLGYEAEIIETFNGECAEPARATNKTTDAMVEYAKNLALDFVVWKDSQYKNIDCFYSDEELFLLFQKTR